MWAHEILEYAIYLQYVCDKNIRYVALLVIKQSVFLYSMPDYEQYYLDI